MAISIAALGKGDVGDCFADARNDIKRWAGTKAGPYGVRRFWKGSARRAALGDTTINQKVLSSKGVRSRGKPPHIGVIRVYD